MRKFILAAAVLILSACTTAQLQTEAVRMQAINEIVCQADATAQPVIVKLISTATVAIDPAATPAVAGVLVIDAAAHDLFQAACPVGTKLLGALAAS